MIRRRPGVLLDIPLFQKMGVAGISEAYGDIRTDAKQSDGRCINVNFPEIGERWGRNK